MSEKDQKVLEMLATALRMEEKGKAFYDKAAAACSNEPGKDIFLSLAKDEVVHMDRIRFIHESLSGGKAWAGTWKDMKLKQQSMAKVFREMAKKHATNVTATADDIESLEIGIEFEAESIKFYQERLEKAEEQTEREFLERMVDEEKSHHAALIDMKLYLSDPAGWFREQERGGLDGA